MAARPLGLILAGHGIVTQAQIDAAIEYQAEHTCRLGEALINLGFCTERHVARALAEQNCIPFVDLDETPPTPQALRLLSKEHAQEYGVIPVRLDGNRLLVVAQNPYDLRIDEVLRRAAGMPVVVAGGVASQLQDYLRRYDELKYPKVNAAALVGSARASITGGPRAPVPVPQRVAAPAPQTAPGLLAGSERPETVKAINLLIAETVRRRASVIYLEPTESGLHVRCRIDGYVHKVTSLGKREGEAVLARVKAMSGIGVVPEDEPATGRCQIHVDGRSVELAASVMNTAAGHMITCQVAGADEPERALDDLGMTPETLAQLRTALLSRQGLLLIAGPVGSGKLTTLHALLRCLSTLGVTVFALEKTFERKLTSISHLDIGDRFNNTLAHALETVLNRRTDAIMVGELPDRLAAEVACRAASTGQMVLAGSHASDSLTAITRITDAGLPPNQLAAPLTVVLTQRLVRRVCDHCAKDYRLPFQLDRAIRARFTIPEGARFRKGKGCPKCNSIGSYGCTGVFEMLVVDDDLRFHLSERVPPSVLQEEIAKRRFRTLEEDTFDKVCRGLVEPEELARLGMTVAAAMEELAAKASLNAQEGQEGQQALEAAAFAFPAGPGADDDGVVQEEELGTWEAVAGFAAMLTGAVNSEAGAAPPGLDAAEPRGWEETTGLAKLLGAELSVT